MKCACCSALGFDGDAIFYSSRIQLYEWLTWSGLRFVEWLIVPTLLIRLVFRERLTDYGVKLTGFVARPDAGGVVRPDAARPEPSRREAGRPPEARFEATAPMTAPPAAAGPPVRSRGVVVEPSTGQPESRGIPGREGGPPREAR